MFNNFFRKLCHYEITWKNTVKTGRTQMKIWRVHISCWTPKAINTNLEYVILTTFPLQQ
jgi:CDP-diacylglycerol pyrophosphatase